MSSETYLIINRLDAERLRRLIEHADDRDLEVAEYLDAEIERGDIVEPEDVPQDVASMNSRISFTDLSHGTQLTRTLVYPQSVAKHEDGLSVFASIGAALLGVRVGDTIKGPLPGGREVELRVDELLYQPERAGEFHR